MGGWDGSNVVIQGSKTDIYDNGYLNQSYHSSGVSTDYAGKIIFENLTIMFQICSFVVVTNLVIINFK